MDHRQMTRISKFLSKHLRHAPADLGLTLQAGGWVAVADLLAGCRRAGFDITREQLQEVVDGNDKQRFAFDDTGERIRANQGHSTDVDLELVPTQPPDVLYHGTSTDAVESIRATGLNRMRRHHVHFGALLMATQQDYQVGTAALATVIAAAIKANVPGFLMGKVQEHQALIDQIERQGAKAVIDAVDKGRRRWRRSRVHCGHTCFS